MCIKCRKSTPIKMYLLLLWYKVQILQSSWICFACCKLEEKHVNILNYLDRLPYLTWLCFSLCFLLIPFKKYILRTLSTHFSNPLMVRLNITDCFEYNNYISVELFIISAKYVECLFKFSLLITLPPNLLNEDIK